MKKVNLLSKAEMRKVMGGVTPEEIGEIGDEGQCVMCTCSDGASSCWYSRRGSAVCNAVCGTSLGTNSLVGVDCGGCTMN